MVGLFSRLSTSVVALACVTQGFALCAVAATQDDTSGTETTTGIRADLEEIMVTARRREESAQDTPLSLVVSTAEMLENRSVTVFTELQQQTPSFQANPSLFGNTSAILSSRGLSLTDIRLNVDPVVGVYQDGVYLPRAVGVNAAELIDVQRVEVLAGPQGTLFGKNTSGGAVRIFTQTPTDILEGLLRVRAGSYGDLAASGVLNVPISSTFGVRVVGSVAGNDGYGTNAFDGSSVGEFDSRYFRATALWSPSDRLTVTLRGDYTWSKSTQLVYKGFQKLAPLTPGVGNGGPSATVEAALELNNIPNLATWQSLPSATRDAMAADADAVLRSLSGGDPSDGNINQPAWEDMTVYGASLELNYDLTSDISLNWLSAIRYFEREGASDLDGTPFTIIQYPYLYADDTQYSTEVQISGSFLDNRLTPIAGVYYATERGDEDSRQHNLAVIGGATALGFQNADVDNESLGVFTQVTFALTDRLNLTGGVRWTDENRELVSSNYNSVNCLSLGVPLASIGGIEGCVRPMQVGFSEWSYTASVEFKPTDELLLYATTRRGFRSGGLQEAVAGTTPAAADTAFIPFDAEVVKDYEIGVKSYLFDRRLRLSVDYYHSDIAGAIRFAPRPVPGSTSTAASLQNAADIDVDGVEFDVLFRPIEQVELGASGAWTDASFVEYVTPTGVDFSHLPVQYSPDFRYSLSAAYIATMSVGQWRTQVDYSWTDEQLTVEPGAFSPSHEIMNARSSLEWVSANMEIAVFAKNITDERFIASPVDLSALGMVTSGPFNPPRTYGVELTKRF